jgi:hypothetical protein
MWFRSVLELKYYLFKIYNFNQNYFLVFFNRLDFLIQKINLKI